MLNALADHTKIYIACGYTDLRKQIDGLAAVVVEVFGQDPCQANALYLFCGRRSDRFKALYWEGDGFMLLYKRLENGRFQWPRTPSEVRELTSQQLRWLLEGLTLDPKKQIKKGMKGRVI